MSKFATRPSNIHAPITTVAQTTPDLTTFECGAGYSRDAKSELFLLAVTNMVSEQTFYETGADRDLRFETLIHQVTAEDPAWVRGFVSYLRDTMQMRSASIVLAAEYVRAKGPNGRRLVDAACQRADEPAEMLAYWRSRHGRSLPAAIKRGVADACRRLYTERNVLKYDGNANVWRFADVIETVRPVAVAEWQNALFRYLLDERHHSDGKIQHGVLPVMFSDYILRTSEPDTRRGMLGGESWNTAGWPWERLSGWLPGGMDAEAWEAVIPQMGYMALLRNLRNFDDAKINADAVATVMAKLTDPAEVARSRQFPIRFYSAWCEIKTLRWAGAIEAALDLSLQNVPELPGRTLVLIDTSGSMNSGMSGRSKRRRYELAALFGCAIAKRSAGSADIVIYATDAASVNMLLNEPLLRAVDGIGRSIGQVGHSTNTFQALTLAYDGHDRVIILTDEQAHDSGHNLPDVPIYTWNLAGYKAGHLPSGQSKRFTFGGMTDAAFRMVPILEGANGASWPFITT